MRDGWVETTLGEVVDLNSEQAKDFNSDRLIRYVDLSTVNFETGISKDIQPMSFSAAPGRARRIIKEGDVIISTVRPYLKGFALVGAKFNEEIASTGFCIARPKPEIVSSYLVWAIISSDEFVKHLVERSTGSNYPAVRPADVSDYSFALPPLHEQKRIVDLISSVDSYIEALQQQVESARRSRNAVLYELLTAGGADWVENSLQETANWSGGVTPSMSNLDFWTNGKIPWISSGDIATYERLGAKKYVTEKALSESTLKLLPVGTVIIVVRSGILLHSLPVAILRERACINQDIKAAQVKDGVIPEFLWIYLRFKEQEILSTCRKTGTTVQSISTDALLSMRILLPPLAEQSRVIEIITSFDAVISNAEAAVINARNLRSGLLSDLLSGNHEIPVTYDKIMGAA